MRRCYLCIVTQVNQIVLAPPRSRAAFAAFAAFGLFWGLWGAALPALRSQAGLSQGELGTALLCIGLGALPAMLVTGRLIERVGFRVVSILLPLLGATGIAVALAAHNLTTLALASLAVGATSGASDVAINALAAQSERLTARPVLTRAHGVFSGAVVVASLAAGAALGRGVPLEVVFAVVAGLMAVLVAGTRRFIAESGAAEVAAPARAGASRRVAVLPFVVLGGVGALAFAAENAHQSWGSVLLTDEFSASPQIAALAPATFAAVAALARLTLAPLSLSHPKALLLAGGALATGGSVVLAASTSVAMAIAGLAIAASGTAVLFPTLLSDGLRDIPQARQARATSVIATAAYLGCLFGPVYVAFIVERVGLRGAFVAVAALALFFTLVATPIVKRVRAQSRRLEA